MTQTQVAAAVIGVVCVVAGLIGIVAPVLPGLLLAWTGVLIWAWAMSSTIAWTAFGVATAALIIGSVIKYLVPGRNLRRAGIPWPTLAIGTLLALVGMFVVPVLGAVLGFVLGVYLAERVRLGTNTLAWPSTVAAVKGVGLSMIIELTAGLVIAAALAAGIIAS